MKPFVTDQLLLLVGQRYDVIVTANQAPGNYWFRAQAAADCATPVNNPGRAVFSYNGASVADPTTTGTTFSTTCKEPTGISPWWPTTIPSSDFKSQAQVLPVDLAIPNVTTNGGNIVAWTVDLTAIAVDWSEPTLQYVINRNTNYPKTYNMIEIPNQGTVSDRSGKEMQTNKDIVDILDHSGAPNNPSSDSTPDSFTRPRFLGLRNRLWCIRPCGQLHISQLRQPH